MKRRFVFCLTAVLLLSTTHRLPAPISEESPTPTPTAAPTPTPTPTSAPTPAAAKKMTIEDYFLLLPRDCFEGSPANWLTFMKQRKGGFIDVPNGYMSCTGNGAQAAFEVALFRYRDGSPLLAVCRAEHFKEKVMERSKAGLVILDFFRLGEDKQMHKIDRSIFPVADAGNYKGNWRFELPRYGRTVLVRNQQTGAISRKLTWDGEKFVDEK